MKKTRILSGFLALIAMVATVGCAARLQSGAGTGAAITARPTVNPIFKRMDRNPYLNLEIDGAQVQDIRQLEGQILAGGSGLVAKVELYQGDFLQPEAGKLVGSTAPAGAKFRIPVQASAGNGKSTFWLSVVLRDDADIDRRLTIRADRVTDASGKTHAIAQQQVSPRYLGFALRKPTEEQVHTYRIPGMVTTDRGTLITVYDIRYDHSGDLPANIDVGMSRSTDGGKTWEGMKNIMDMGGPRDNSGCGDPSVLFDPATKTIWVAALWSKGNRSIAGSGPGLTPDETGQFLITKSTDDGLTWSKPYSITNQVKNPEWRLFFPGPGNGIAMADGKLVFPAQYWDAAKMPHSTLIYSADHGQTWKAGVGAKSNTTEAQLVENQPGTIMLNMRDNRGKFRSVATTTDLGQTWTEHATSRSALPDPVCMASLIKAPVQLKGGTREVLFFSNLNTSTGPRAHTTVKASLDLGESWTAENSLYLDERRSYGYSCLSQIDGQTLGLLYEGVGSLLFVRIPVKDVVKQSAGK
ncbi:glycosyl hydrolase [Pedobacter yulinensis]|uniref:exo-alpha-sialidase n=1 Tax=Pedobacter yulinensis TaxID=2126353 RepID=A0A2T3HHZ5_9SPHI|nr:sialidase family protein [Pedobacter yulinensis]PST82057.1 glycosyl hydrolase [Pedobacter yulinensis]